MLVITRNLPWSIKDIGVSTIGGVWGTSSGLHFTEYLQPEHDSEASEAVANIGVRLLCQWQIATIHPQANIMLTSHLIWSYLLISLTTTTTPSYSNHDHILTENEKRRQLPVKLARTESFLTELVFAYTPPIKRTISTSSSQTRQYYKSSTHCDSIDYWRALVALLPLYTTVEHQSVA